METEIIRHRRLFAFYQSKVLNALMIAIVVCLLLMYYIQSTLLPAICGGMALLFFTGYSLWLWIKKPTRVVINRRLSDFSGLFTLYFLIVGAMKASNQWWYITPIILAVVVLFISLITHHDEQFDI